jgi:hypothetical protein
VAQLPDPVGDLGIIRFIVEVTRRDGTVEYHNMADFIVADDDEAPCQPKKETG